VSDCAEVRCVGRLIHRLAAETGKAAVKLKDGSLSCSELDDGSLDRDGT